MSNTFIARIYGGVTVMFQIVTLYMFMTSCTYNCHVAAKTCDCLVGHCTYKRAVFYY
jgi:hypothetical protein